MSQYPLSAQRDDVKCVPKNTKLIMLKSVSTATAANSPGTSDNGAFAKFESRFNLGFTPQCVYLRGVVVSNIRATSAATSKTIQNPTDSFVLSSNLVEDRILAIIPPMTTSTSDSNYTHYQSTTAKFYLKNFQDGRTFTFELRRASDNALVIGKGPIPAAATPDVTQISASVIMILLEFSTEDYSV